MLYAVETNEKNSKETTELQAQWLINNWLPDEFLLIFQGSPNLFCNPFQINTESVIYLKYPSALLDWLTHGFPGSVPEHLIPRVGTEAQESAF